MLVMSGNAIERMYQARTRACVSRRSVGVKSRLANPDNRRSGDQISVPARRSAGSATHTVNTARSALLV